MRSPLLLLLALALAVLALTSAQTTPRSSRPRALPTPPTAVLPRQDPPTTFTTLSRQNPTPTTLSTLLHQQREPIRPLQWQGPVGETPIAEGGTATASELELEPEPELRWNPARSFAWRGRVMVETLPVGGGMERVESRKREEGVRGKPVPGMPEQGELGWGFGAGEGRDERAGDGDGAQDWRE